MQFNRKNQSPKPQSAKEVIAANAKALIEQLEQGHSDALTAYLNAMARFHSYSFGNILEIARQKPDAVRVARLYAWNHLGRRVKKGENGIRILAPIIGVRRKKDDADEKDTTTQNRRISRIPFGMGLRCAQTEGAELPESASVKGDGAETMPADYVHREPGHRA